jgi:hypothetical protein
VNEIPALAVCLCRCSAVDEWLSRAGTEAHHFCFADSSSGVQSSHTDIPALRKENAQEEDEEEHAGTNPAVGCVRGRGIEVGLIVLWLMY